MNTLIKILLISLFGLLFNNLGFSQEDSKLLEIKRDFQKWQPIIDSGFDTCPKYFKYAWGKYYQFNEWFHNIQNNDSLTIAQVVSIIEKEDLGYFVRVENCSFSGDWHIVIDYYFNKEEQLHFIFWRMNTFYAEKPLTVEKRLYFDCNGEIIQILKNVYRINTKEKIEINFMDKEVDYKLTLSEMEFYKYWNNEN